MGSNGGKNLLYVGCQSTTERITESEGFSEEPADVIYLTIERLRFAKRMDQQEPTVSVFAAKVYAVVRKIPEGQVSTYRDVAHAVGSRSYRGVGQALRCNPFAPEVPCHRVVKSDGRLGGFKGRVSGDAIDEKVTLLESEGVVVLNGRVDLGRYMCAF